MTWIPVSIFVFSSLDKAEVIRTPFSGLDISEMNPAYRLKSGIAYQPPFGTVEDN
jgi:hypothetical protein